jgi:alkylhydroperoxidase/carboxymuconolactone decarboxylase family protein YurZ
MRKDSSPHRWSEFPRENAWPTYVMGAISAGGEILAKQDVKEILLQAAIYCGLPAANKALRAAVDVFSALERQEST